MNSVIKRSLSFVLMSAFALALYTPASAAVIASTPYVSTGCTDISVTVSKGRSGGAVTALQQFLHAHGYLSVTPTGYFGPMTQAGVIKFQKENGLKADGIVGPNTRAHIFTKDCSATSPVSTPTITGIVPAQGTIGSTVTIVGSGFSETSILHFSIGSISNPIVGNNGTTLTFTIPEYIGPYCKPNMACLAYAQVISNGNHPIFVENANGAMSNTVQFTVTGAPNPFPQAL